MLIAEILLAIVAVYALSLVAYALVKNRRFRTGLKIPGALFFFETSAEPPQDESRRAGDATSGERLLQAVSAPPSLPPGAS
jgi:hypothetical protein